MGLLDSAMCQCRLAKHQAHISWVMLFPALWFSEQVWDQKSNDIHFVKNDVFLLINHLLLINSFLQDSIIIISLVLATFFPFHFFFFSLPFFSLIVRHFSVFISFFSSLAFFSLWIFFSLSCLASVSLCRCVSLGAANCNMSVLLFLSLSFSLCPLILLRSSQRWPVAVLVLWSHTKAGRLWFITAREASTVYFIFSSFSPRPRGRRSNRLSVFWYPPFRLRRLANIALTWESRKVTLATWSHVPVLVCGSRR